MLTEAKFIFSILGNYNNRITYSIEYKGSHGKYQATVSVNHTYFKHFNTEMSSISSAKGKKDIIKILGENPF